MPACLKLLTKVAMTSAIEVHKKQTDLCFTPRTTDPCINLEAYVSASSIQTCKPQSTPSIDQGCISLADCILSCVRDLFLPETWCCLRGYKLCVSVESQVPESCPYNKFTFGMGHCLAVRRTTVYPRPLPGAAPAFALARAATALPLPPTPMGTFFICRPEVN